MQASTELQTLFLYIKCQIELLWPGRIIKESVIASTDPNITAAFAVTTEFTKKSNDSNSDQITFCHLIHHELAID